LAGLALGLWQGEFPSSSQRCQRVGVILLLGHIGGHLSVSGAGMDRAVVELVVNTFDAARTVFGQVSIDPASAGFPLDNPGW